MDFNLVADVIFFAKRKDKDALLIFLDIKIKSDKSGLNSFVRALRYKKTKPFSLQSEVLCSEAVQMPNDATHKKSFYFGLKLGTDPKSSL